jgi:hypothetical protein
VLIRGYVLIPEKENTTFSNQNGKIFQEFITVFSFQQVTERDSTFAELRSRIQKNPYISKVSIEGFAQAQHQWRL